jgi:hypothetical protein
VLCVFITDAFITQEEQSITAQMHEWDHVLKLETVKMEAKKHVMSSGEAFRKFERDMLLT